MLFLLYKIKTTALPRLETGPLVLPLPSPPRPCGNSSAIPENEGAVALLYFSGDDSGLAREGHPRALDLYRVAFLYLRIKSFNLPFRTELNGDCLLVSLEHNVYT